jgi:hypothetical protein
MGIENLVIEFADCVAAQEAAISAADPIRGNRFAARYAAAFERLRSIGDGGREALATLLTDDRPVVRVTAAACLLSYCGDRAKIVLETEARGGDLVAFAASQALQRWEEGTWALDHE